jgi:hypothetical protein
MSKKGQEHAIALRGSNIFVKRAFYALGKF